MRYNPFAVKTLNWFERIIWLLASGLNLGSVQKVVEKQEGRIRPPTTSDFAIICAPPL
jgi:hypothetical protein